MIKNDIALFEDAIIHIEKSNAIFNTLKVKYMAIDKDFLVGFSNYVKTLNRCIPIKI